MEKLVTINIPEDVKYLLKMLIDSGYEAYVVGGCVRDSILGRPIHDWDLTTNAKPEDIIEIFGKVIPTGIKHGTVTIMLNNVGYEITTYRIDKNCDGRHAEVEFFNNLKQTKENNIIKDVVEQFTNNIKRTCVNCNLDKLIHLFNVNLFAI